MVIVQFNVYIYIYIFYRLFRGLYFKRFGKFSRPFWDNTRNQITSSADIYHFYNLVRDFHRVFYRFLFVHILYFIVIIVIYMKIPWVHVCGSENSYRGHVAESGGVNFYPVKIYSVYFPLFIFSSYMAIKRGKIGGQYIYISDLRKICYRPVKVSTARHSSFSFYLFIRSSFFFSTLF